MPDPSASEFTGPYLLLAICFVALNAFFVAAEFALVKIRATRLEVLASRGDVVARLAVRMVENMTPYLSATQLGITLASLGLGWVGEPAFAHIIHPLVTSLFSRVSEPTIHSISFTVAFMTISSLHIILGELVPKSFALQAAERICLFVAVPLRAFYLVFSPFLWILSSLSGLIIKAIRMATPPPTARAHTEEELKLIVEDSYEEGTIGSRKKVLLDKALDFSHKTVRDIMIPRDKMICLYLSDSLHANIESVREWGHTRYPLFDNRGGHHLGFVHMKDIIWSLDNGEVINLFDLMRPIISFAPDTKLDSALLEFQRKKVHVAVVEESGKAIGLVTLEDVIEQIVGKIEDEFDTAPVHPAM